MKIGITTNCLSNFETEDALAELKDIGAQTCGIDLRTFYEYRPEFAKKFAPRAEGVEVCSLGVAQTGFEPQLFSENRRVRGDGFYWLDQIMRSAQLFSAEYYVLRGHACAGKDYNFLADRLWEIVSFCGRYGKKVCLENSPSGIFNTPYVFSELKNRCGEISGALNMGCTRSGYPYQMYISGMAGSIALVRISDVDKDGNACLAGEGIYDFREILKRLKDAGFDGAALIEGFGDVGRLKRSVRFLNDLTAEL